MTATRCDDILTILVIDDFIIFGCGEAMVYQEWLRVVNRQLCRDIKTCKSIQVISYFLASLTHQTLLTFQERRINLTTLHIISNDNTKTCSYQWLPKVLFYVAQFVKMHCATLIFWEKRLLLSFRCHQSLSKAKK